MLLTRRGSNPQPPDHQSDAHPTEPPRPAEGCRKDCRFAKSKPHTSPEAAPYINPFTPELLKWIVPSLYLGMSFIANGVSVKNKNRMENGIDPDEIAHYESSHLDLHCLQRYLVWSAELKGLTECEVHFIIWGNNSACYGYIQRWLTIQRTISHICSRAKEPPQWLQWHIFFILVSGKLSITIARPPPPLVSINIL